MSNHTPAPWRVDRGSMLDGVNVITPRHEWICYLGMASRPDVVADANLIAAAPELLEALEWVMRSLPSSRDWFDPVCERFCSDAIAKAKGEI